jgi:hypothetical protein
VGRALASNAKALFKLPNKMAAAKTVLRAPSPLALLPCAPACSPTATKVPRRFEKMTLKLLAFTKNLT